jgi:DNA-binding response OmpR family regulator
MKKILIVEDDTFLKNMEVTKFTKAGFEVSYASTEAEFDTELAKAPECILLDLMLPGTDGYHLLDKARQNKTTKNIPIIVFSNLGTAADIEKAKNLGATDFMIKAQFTLDEIVDRIKEF